MKNTRKSNAQILPPEVVNDLERIEWESMPEKTRGAIITLLQFGDSAVEIEAHMLGVIKKQYPHLPAWRQRNHAARYFMAANHALRNNLHLN